jgi:hypothetical protein
MEWLVIVQGVQKQCNNVVHGLIEEFKKNVFVT